MAIDPHPPTAAQDLSPIDNELAAYRAISRLAIVSLILGASAILTFVAPWFGLLGLGALVVGLLAQRAIRRRSDTLTGRRLADLGIALGLFFSLSAITFSGVRSWTYSRALASFGPVYERVLNEGTMPEVLLYRLHAESRLEKTPEQNMSDIKAQQPDPSMFEEMVRPIEAIKSKLAEVPGSKVRFDRVETQMVDGATIYGSLIFLLSGAEGTPPERIGVRVRGSADLPAYGWFVEDLRYPIDSANKILPLPPRAKALLQGTSAPPDGHDHGHELEKSAPVGKPRG